MLLLVNRVHKVLWDRKVILVYKDRKVFPARRAIKET